ncbi:uncharacterized protein PAC_12973 [Phialocephala subalpina]|uniref:Uncharacterized protein n=1 Tax=Phialocephala subalpina TaxID=576137 RepID=A0A1L7XDL3_9HELO|nr:uncharacterized protein PAC_12973 [Phialocephala subalpina]
MPRYELDTRSITGMNGSVQGYEPAYRTIDAREYSSLRSQRLESISRREEPFHLREQSVTSSRRAMSSTLSDFDRMFAGRR